MCLCLSVRVCVSLSARMSNEEYGDYVSIAGRPGRREMGAVSVLGCPAPMGGFQGRHDLVTCSSDVVCPPASLPPGWLARANLAEVPLCGPLCVAEPLRRLRLYRGTVSRLSPGCAAALRAPAQQPQQTNRQQGGPPRRPGAMKSTRCKRRIRSRFMKMCS